MLPVADLFELHAVPQPLRALLEVDAPWEALARMDAFLADLPDRRAGHVHESAVLEGRVHVEAGAAVAPGAWIQGPAWIGAGAEVGHGATVRGGCVIAAGARAGHATEVKRSLLLPGAKAPHFNYVGDSVLGSGVNLGAGVKLANYKNDGGAIFVDGHATGLRKFGACVGDGVAIGCNAVLMPGTLVGARAVLYAGVVARGIVPPDTVVKLRQATERDARH